MRQKGSALKTMKIPIFIRFLFPLTLGLVGCAQGSENQVVYEVVDGGTQYLPLAVCGDYQCGNGEYKVDGSTIGYNCGNCEQFPVSDRMTCGDNGYKNQCGNTCSPLPFTDACDAFLYASGYDMGQLDQYSPACGTLDMVNNCIGIIMTDYANSACSDRVCGSWTCCLKPDAGANPQTVQMMREKLPKNGIVGVKH